jgi:hypothetical protein
MLRGRSFGPLRPDSEELRVALGERDRHLARVLASLEARVGKDYLLAVTADHGAPSSPPPPDRWHLVSSIVDLLHEKFDPDGKQLITSYEAENSEIFVDEETPVAPGPDVARSRPLPGIAAVHLRRVHPGRGTARRGRVAVVLGEA